MPNEINVITMMMVREVLEINKLGKVNRDSVQDHSVDTLQQDDLLFFFKNVLLHSVKHFSELSLNNYGFSCFHVSTISILLNKVTGILVKLWNFIRILLECLFFKLSGYFEFLRFYEDLTTNDFTFLNQRK